MNLRTNWLVVVPLFCFVLQCKTALLCGTSRDLSPRITCPASQNVPADPITCDAVVTWEDFQYFPSPFFSSGVDSTPQRNKLNRGTPDSHFSYTNINYGTPLTKDDDYPTAECKTIGIQDSIFDLLNLGGQRFATELIIDFTAFNHSNVESNFYVSVEGFFDPFRLNGIPFSNRFDPTGLRSLSIPSEYFQAGQNVLRVTSVSQSFLLVLLPTSADFTACLSGVATPLTVGYTDDCFLDANAFSISHQSGDRFPMRNSSTLVTSSVTDSSSQTASCQFSISLYDDSPPDISGCMESLALSLDSNGQALLMPSDVFAFDPMDCSGWEYASSNVFFDCSQAGSSVTVSTVVRDRIGFQSTCQTNVMIKDDLQPELVCHSSVNVEPGDLHFADLLIEASDNCPSVLITLSQTVLVCPVLSPVTVVVYGTDSSGNVAQCSVSVFVDCPSVTPSPAVTPSTSQTLTNTPASTSSLSTTQTPLVTPTSTASAPHTSSLSPWTPTTTPPKTPLSTPSGTLSAPQTPLSTPSGTLSAKQTPLSTPSGTLSAPHTPLSTPSGTLSANQTPLSTPSGTLSAKQTPLSTPSAPLSSSQTLTPTPSGTLSAKQTPLSTPSGTLSAQQTHPSTPSKTLSEPQTPPSTPSGTLSAPQTPLSTLSGTLSAEQTPLSTPSGTLSAEQTPLSTSPSGTFSATQTLTSTRSGTLSAQQTLTPTPSETTSSTQTPLSTPSGTLSAPQTPLSTLSGTLSAPQTPLPSPSATLSAQQTRLSTPSGSLSAPQTPLSTPSGTTSAPQSSLTPTSTPISTPSLSAPQTLTPTPSGTLSTQQTLTPTPSETTSSTQTPLSTPSRTVSAQQTLTLTPSGTLSAPQTLTPTPSETTSSTQTPLSTPSGTVSAQQTPMLTASGTLVHSSPSLLVSNMLGPYEESSIQISRSATKSNLPSQVILASRSPFTSLVLIYDQNNSTIGSVTVPLEYQDHEIIYEVLSPTSQTASPIIDLSLIDSLGNEVFNFIQNIEICIQPFSNINLEDSCLGYQKLNGQFTCEDSCLDSSSDTLCGKTDHFTSFALLLNHPSHDPKDDGCENVENFDRIILWLSVAFVVFACCLVVICMGFIEARYRIKRRNQISKGSVVVVLTT